MIYGSLDYEVSFKGAFADINRKGFDGNIWMVLFRALTSEMAVL